MKFLKERVGFEDKVEDMIEEISSDDSCLTFKKDRLLWLLKDGLIINFFEPEDRVFIHYSKKKNHDIEFWKEMSQKFKLDKTASCIHLVVKAAFGKSLKRVEIDVPNINLNLNYGFDFENKAIEIESLLSKKNDKGLLLFYGPAGTGKTTFLKYLTSKIDKKFIYVPQNIMFELIGPTLLSFMLDNRNSILVIEDAEKILLDREKGGNGVVSSLLNLTDGFLSECLHVQIICTFNTSLKNIDRALLRKGRLRFSHKFDLLSAKEASALSNHLGQQRSIRKPTSLSDVYNSENDKFQMIDERPTVGFHN